MSAVLWANQLKDGKVTSDQSDKRALYKHAERLDELAKTASFDPLSSLFDFTDLKVNLEEMELPAGMRSTNELMARDGVWKSAEEALAVLNGLLNVVTSDKPRFGLLKNDYDEIVAELTESIGYAKQAAAQGAKFNFCVVS